VFVGGAAVFAPLCFLLLGAVVCFCFCWVGWWGGASGECSFVMRRMNTRVIAVVGLDDMLMAVRKVSQSGIADRRGRHTTRN